jgi:integrase
MSVHRKKDGRYFVRYRDENAKQKTKYYGRGKDAKKEADLFDREIKLKKKRGEPLAGPKGSICLDELAQYYVEHLKANGRSRRGLKELAGLLNNHVFKILPRKPVDQLEYLDMLKVAEYYSERSQATRSRYFSSLKAMFRFGIDQGITSKNPLAKWKKPRDTQAQVKLTVEDLQKIYDSAAPHLQWALEVEFNLACRPGPSELFALKWDNVDFRNHDVWVPSPKTAGKTGENGRAVPITEEFRAQLLLMKQQAKTEYIIEYQGKPVKQLLRRSLRTACKKAGIDYRVRFYDLRHLAITDMLNKGGDLAAVSKIAGHYSTQMTTDRYYHVMKDAKKRAVRLISPLRNRPDGEKVISMVGQQNG